MVAPPPVYVSGPPPQTVLPPPYMRLSPPKCGAPPPKCGSPPPKCGSPPPKLWVGADPAPSPQWAELTDRTLARCPHCRKVSAIGRRFPRRRCLCCLLLALLMAGAAAGLAVGTWVPARRLRPLHAGWALLGAGAGACLLRAAYWGCVRVSQPLPPRA
ncbi:type 1 phosphatidylinositol 4,5-bisphosphate 4-phosphatase-like, partial [Mycteria americana]|uniref:type 1 phosphatidylinositol 4,5-bisphosphate 4-phosphatase-like n=1 Tax=Mycteria americana TaxID=33587 RepID=UPI003F58D189